MSVAHLEIPKLQLPTDANISGRTFGNEELELLRNGHYCCASLSAA